GHARRMPKHGPLSWSGHCSLSGSALSTCWPIRLTSRLTLTCWRTPTRCAPLRMTWWHAAPTIAGAAEPPAPGPETRPAAAPACPCWDSCAAAREVLSVHGPLNGPRIAGPVPADHETHHHP